MLQVLSADLLNAEQILFTVPRQVAQQGNRLHEQGLARVEHVDAQSARISVAESSQVTHVVTVRLNHNQLLLGCTCPQRHYWSLCRHRVAGVLALRDHLLHHPPSVWRAVLGQAIDSPARRPTPTQRARILFSIQRSGAGWLIVPYALAERHIPPEARAGAEALARFIAESDVSAEARPLRARVSRTTFPDESAEAVAAANMAIMAASSYPYGYGGDGGSSYESVLTLLPGKLVYLGDDANPLRRRANVLATPTSLELSLDPAPEGAMRLQATLAANGRVLPLDLREAEPFIRSPLWLLIGATLVPVSDPSGAAAMLISHPELVIPPADQPEFLDRFLLPLAETLPLRGELLVWDDVESPAQPRLYLSEAQGELRAELRFAYGDHELPAEKSPPLHSVRRKPDELALARLRRQPDAELAAHQALASGFGLKKGADYGRFELRKTIHPVDFLLHQVPRLTAEGFVVYGEEQLSSARVNRNRPSISFRVSSGIDWFDLQAVVQFGDVEVSLKEIRRAVRRRERFVKLADGTIGAIPDDWIERYRHLFALGEETDAGLRLGAGHLTLIDQLLGEADRVQTDAAFEERRERLRSFERIAPQSLPRGFRGELRPYQKSGYDWLHFLYEYGFGGCLADDMGTGKTITTLAFLQSLKERAPDGPASLLVMPRSLLFNWEREIQQFAPELRAVIHHEQGRAADPSAFDAYDLVLTTYGTMLRDVELLRKYRFRYAILDESQAIKNPVAETSKAARLLNAEHRLALTGTPVENSAIELWSQFAFLNPGLLGSLDYYREEFVTPIERKQDAATAQFLRRMVYPFILRRTKDQVAPDLPPRTERVLETEMEPAQRRLYTRQRDYYRALLLGLIEQEGIDDARLKIFEGLLRLRQICNHPRLVDEKFRGGSGKFELLVETLETLAAEGHKALVFSQFVQMLTIVREALDARRIPYAYLDGQTRARQKVVDRFQSDPDTPFFLISLKAGGVGLNLTAADYVIHIDPWWNPAVEMQATDRTHRIGQQKPVFVYKLVTRDSVEEKILQLQERKRELVEQLIAADGGMLKSLTREDVEVLFS